MCLVKWCFVVALVFLCEGSPCSEFSSDGFFEWYQYEGFCYSSADNIPYSWEEANRACNNISGTLVSIHSLEELNILRGTLQWSTDIFWIGLRAKGLYAPYEWIDGTAVDFVNWQSEDSEGRRFDIETCVYLNPSTGLFGRQHCNEVHFYICKVKDSSGAEPTTSPVSATALPGFCPDGWNVFGEKCYGMFGMEIGSKERWANANQICLEMGTTMISIHSKEEQDFVSLKMTGITDMAWTGLSETASDEDRAFRWSDGSPVDFSYWDVGEPNNWDGYKEECVNIRFDSPHFGRWNDAPCDSVPQSYICQTHTVPNQNTSTQDNLCSNPEGWLKLGHVCYKIFGDSESHFTWSDAQAQCKKFGGNLVSVRSIREATFLRFHVAQLHGNFWIGMRNKGKYTKYSWITGPVLYSNWNRGQPFEISNQTNCVVTDADGRWIVRACDERNTFICEVYEGTFAVTPAEQELGTICPNSSLGWIDYGGEFCYIIELKNQVTWYEAAHRCFQQGGFMASFHSIDEVSMIQNQTKRYGKSLHIGLGQTDSGDFEWIDRSAVDFAYWEIGKPNFDSKMCVEMSSPSGKWTDIPCESKRGYICSVSKIPSSTVNKISAEKGERKLGVGGIMGIILCILTIATIAVATYCYLYPSMQRMNRLTVTRIV